MLVFFHNHTREHLQRYILYISVGADNVFNLIRIRILKCEAAGSDQHPFPVFGTKTIHHREDLTFQLHNLQNHLERLIKEDCYLLCKWIVNSSNWCVLNLSYRNYGHSREILNLKRINKIWFIFQAISFRMKPSRFVVQNAIFQATHKDNTDSGQQSGCAVIPTGKI